MKRRVPGIGIGAALVFLLAALPLASGSSPDWSGTWRGKTIVAENEDAITLVLIKNKSSYSGTIQDGLGIIPPGTELREVKIASPDGLTFAFLTGTGVRIEAVVTVLGESMKGRWTDSVNGETGPIELARRP